MTSKIKLNVEVGACSECDKEPICKLKEEKQNMVRVIKSLDNTNTVESPFNVNIECKYFDNKKMLKR